MFSNIPYLSKLQEVALKEGIKEVYLVGGCLRNLLLQKPVQDWDIAVKGKVKEIASLFAQVTGGHFVVLDEEWQTYRVVKSPTYFDFTPLRGQDIYADLWQRDFTINALALDIFAQDKLIDPTGGQEDLKKRIIRVIAPKAFLDDPLRVLRGFRLAAELNFELELNTKETIKRYAYLLDQVAAERIYQEFKRLFFTPRTSRWIKEMGRLNVFKVLLPEIESLKGVTQDGFHHLDVYAHSLLALEKIEEIIYTPREVFRLQDFKEISAYLAEPSHRFCLKWAAICHDLGKPACRAEGERRITFYEHDKVGARLFKKIAMRLRFPGKEAELIAFFIEKHMWPFHLLSLFLKNELTLRAIRRFIHKTEPHTIGLLLLAMADNLAAQGVGKPDGYDKAFLKFMQTVLEERRSYLQLKQRPRLVTGHDLIYWFQLEPGPIIGQLLKEIEEAQLNKEVKTKEEARKWLEKRLIRVALSQNVG